MQATEANRSVSNQPCDFCSGYACTVTVTDLIALTLTWTAPWPCPTSNYTITMLNLSSGQENQWTVYIIAVNGGGCD